MGDFVIPPHISEEARAYYTGPRPPQTPGDITDPKVAQRARDTLHPDWRSVRDAIAYPYKLEQTELAGVDVYWVSTDRTTDAERVLLYFHGGAYVLGNPEVHATVAIQVAHESGIRVLSVDYRKAPEHPFPAAVDDGVAVYRALLERGYAPGRIGVFGDSAGGGLALAVPLALRDAGDPLPGAIAPLSPWVDLLAESDTLTTLADFDPDVDPADSLLGYIRAYAAGQDPGQPLISPVNADLTGLPPLLIQVGAREVLLSEALRLARNARNSGVEVDLDVWDGMWHVFQALPTAPEAQRANREIGAFFRRHLEARG
jgi:monoterpene epsilon-lactone hydrolase